MAGLTKTWSGDLTQEIACRILNAIKNYDDEDGNKGEASTSVKQAAKNLDKDDGSIRVNSSSIVVKDTILPVHIEVVTLGKETKKLSGKVTAIGTGLADTQKLIGTQNEMLEKKFDTILALLSGGVGGGGEGGTLGSGGASGSGGIQKVSANAGDRLSAFFGRKFMIRGARALLRRGTKMLPKTVRRNLLRMRNAPRRVGKKVLRKAVTKFATSGVGKKIGTKIGAKAITKGVGKGVGKSLAKKVPLVGAAMGAIFAVDRLRKGDFLGAGLELASGIASIFPGIGTGISVGIDAALIARDIAKEGGNNKQSNVQSNSSPGGSRTISGYEKGTGGTNIMGFFKQAGSLLVSSVLPVAAATGTLSEVQAQITDAGLDYPIAPLPPIPVKIGQGKVETPAQVESKTHSKIPGFGGRKKEETETETPSDNRNIFQKSGDWIKEKASDTWNWLKEGTQSNVKKIQSFVSNTAEKVNNSEVANKVRNVIGSEKGDGFIGPKWMGIKNPFAKEEEKEEEKAVTPKTSGTDYDQYSGAKAIMSIDPDITELGAAYLAGNIQQESGWDGMRSWGEVLGDGTSRNGGLVSWASWKDDPARLGAIEEFYGKKIEEITEHEQLKWMIKEMKQSYAGAYKIFTDPKASEEDLMKASKWYWGYGEEGSRFRYATNIYQELLRTQFNEQKGESKEGEQKVKPSAEKGAILPPSNVTTKSQQVQHASASIDEIEDQAPAQPIVYLTNMEVSSTPLVMPKSSSRNDDFVSRYRFMSLGAA